MSWKPATFAAVHSSLIAGARFGWLYFSPDFASTPSTGWQLLQVSALKLASAVTRSIFACDLWQVKQFAIDCGYANSIAWDWWTSCITLSLYAYLALMSAGMAAVPFAAQAAGSSTIHCQSW